MTTLARSMVVVTIPQGFGKTALRLDQACDGPASLFPAGPPPLLSTSTRTVTDLIGYLFRCTSPPSVPSAIEVNNHCSPSEVGGAWLPGYRYSCVLIIRASEPTTAQTLPYHILYHQAAVRLPSPPPRRNAFRACQAFHLGYRHRRDGRATDGMLIAHPGPSKGVALTPRFMLSQNLFMPWLKPLLDRQFRPQPFLVAGNGGTHSSKAKPAPKTAPSICQLRKKRALSAHCQHTPRFSVSSAPSSCLACSVGVD